MERFIPHGYTSVAEANHLLSQKWFPDDLAKAKKAEELFISCRDRRFAIAERKRSGHQLTTFEIGILNSDYSHLHSSASEAFEALKSNAWRRLRQMLFAGQVPFVVHSSDGGFLEDIDKTIWGSQIADNPVEELRSVRFNSDPRPFNVNCVPLIADQHLSALLEGKALPILDDQREAAEKIVTGRNRSEVASNRGGAPKDYVKMKAFYMAACHVLYNDSSKATDELSFRKAIRDRTASLGLDEISDPTLRKWSEELWKVMLREEENEP